MGTTLATYYAKLQDMPDSEYKVEILEDGPIKKIAVNGKIYEVDYNMGGDSIHSIIIDHHSHVRGEKRCVSKFGRSENI